MRQRKIKDLEDKLREYQPFIAGNPKDHKGKWKELFGNDQPIYLEIGCGKGQFIMENVKRYPERNFIAVEGHESVVLRALQKAGETEPKNLYFVLEYIQDIREYFEEGELAGIYLNFSDPWPKERHAKRRLTYGERLVQYCELLGRDGFVQFKTDNEGLFSFTLEQIEEKNLEIMAISRDLHHSELAAENITTEYEDKFARTGKNINYVKIRA